MSTSLRKSLNSRKFWYHPYHPDIRPTTKSTYENQESNCSRLSTPIRKAKDKKPVALEHFLLKENIEHSLKSGENI